MVMLTNYMFFPLKGKVKKNLTAMRYSAWEGFFNKIGHIGAVVLIVAGLSLTAKDVSATTYIEVFPIVNINGSVQDAGICSGTFPTGYGFRVYSGSYPATSSLISDVLGNAVCESGVFGYLPTSPNSTYIEGSSADALWYNSSPVSTPDGNYWFAIANSGTMFSPDWNGNVRYFEAIRIAGLWYPKTEPTSTSTRIISLTPENGTTTQSGVPVDFGLHMYIAPEDIGSIIRLRFTLHNIDQNTVAVPDFLPTGIDNLINTGFSMFSDDDIFFFNDYPITEAGHFYFSTSTLLSDGNYRIQAKLERSFMGVFDVPFGTLLDVSNQFIVGQSTYLGTIRQQGRDIIGYTVGSTTATSTESFNILCNPFSGSISTLFYNPDFAPLGCIVFLTVPDSEYFFESLKMFKDTMGYSFPIGYVTDFIDIVSTSTVGSLTVIDTTMPSALGLGTDTIRLDLTGVLDPVLNATSGVFFSANATSTDTLYEITYPYWRIIVIVGLMFYILRRILGTHIIPHPFQEMSGDRDVSNESYRLKEKLWKMKYGNVRYTGKVDHEKFDI